MFSESLAPFFADFGVTATFGAYTGQVLLDAPENFVGDGSVISGDYKITFPTGQYPGLDYGSAITVDGTAYTVNTVAADQDGKLQIATLSKA